MMREQAMEVRRGLQARCSHRCLVLVPALVEVPGNLLAALHQRGLTAVVVSDQPAVMVELARYGGFALIVTYPDQISGAQPLVDAVRQYFPRTVCWQYVCRDVGAALLPINGRVGSVQNQTDRSARLEEDRRRLASLLVRVDNEPDKNEPLVSEDEMSMLLGPLPQGEAEESV